MSEPLHSSLSYNGNKFSVTNNAVTFENESRGSGIHHLSHKISTNALLDSPSRDPPPRCYANTRTFALDTIVNFVDDPEPDEKVMWMNAPGGHGKSAIMQTFVETLRASGYANRVAGAFFFRHDKEGHDIVRCFLPTILYQIAHNIPGMYKHINEAIESDPTLLSKPIENQLIPLLVDPFRHYSPSATHTPTVFIDGLNECDISAQQSVLKMIADALTVHQVPLRFVIASRAETHLDEYFKKGPLQSVTHIFSLDDDFDGMWTYYRDGFDRIYASRTNEMSEVPTPWPSNEIIEDLIRRASGQYLFACTILRFVGDEDGNPLEQLQVIFTTRPQCSSASSNMDALYEQILLVCPEHLRDCRLRVLGALFVLENPAIAALSDLLQETVLDIITVLRSLRAVVKVDDSSDSCQPFQIFDSPRLSLYHVSFREFMTDRARAGEQWIDEDGMKKELIHQANLLLESFLSDEPATIHHQTWSIIEALALRSRAHTAKDIDN